MFEVNTSEIYRSGSRFSYAGDDLRMRSHEVRDIGNELSDLSGMWEICQALEGLAGHLAREADNCQAAGTALGCIAQSYDDTEEEIIDRILTDEVVFTYHPVTLRDFSGSGARGSNLIDMRTMQELTALIS